MDGAEEQFSTNFESHFSILSPDTWIAADRGRKRYFNGGERERW